MLPGHLKRRLMSCCAQSKEQIKQLRAQKAVEAQRAADLAQAEKRKAAAAISIKPKVAAGMPPPPPRAPSGPIPAVTNGKSSKTTSVNQPQVAVIHHSPRKGKQDSTAAARTAEQAQPSGVYNFVPAFPFLLQSSTANALHSWASRLVKNAVNNNGCLSMQATMNCSPPCRSTLNRRNGGMALLTSKALLAHQTSALPDKVLSVHTSCLCEEKPCSRTPAC